MVRILRMARVTTLPMRNCGIVETAFDGHVQNDFAFAVLQNRDGQAHWQMRRVRAVHLFAERKLVERDDIFRFQFFADQFILEVHVQFALGDAVAGKFSRIRTRRRQVHVLHGNFHVVRLRAAERVDGAGDGDRADAVHLRVQIHIRVLELFRGKPGNRAIHLLDGHVHVRLERTVGETDGGVGNDHRADGNAWQRGSRICGGNGGARVLASRSDDGFSLLPWLVGSLAPPS